MTFAAVCGIVAGALALIQAVPYIISIFQGKTKPSRVSYAIFATSATVRIGSYIAVGASTTVWYPIVLGITTIFFFGLSLTKKYGYTSPLTKMDKFCLTTAAMAFFSWALIGPEVALYVSLVTTVTGYYPTIVKAHKHPDTENLLSWQLTVVASILNVAALTTLTPAIALLPLVSLLCSGATVAGIYLGLRHRAIQVDQ